MTRKKVAIILSRFPFPLDKGDKLRAFHQIKHLSKSCELYLYCLSDEKVTSESIEKLTPFCKSIQIFNLNRMVILLESAWSFLKRIPVQVGYFHSPFIKKKIQEQILELKPDIVYCQLSRTAFYGKDLPFKKVIDFQDAFSINYDRIQANYSGFRKWFYQREGKRMAEFEIEMMNWFDGATIISEFDKQQINMLNNKLVVVSNGVDSHYFSPKQIAKKYDILFSGNLSYLPNQKAVEFLVDKIVPLLIQKRPEIKIEIVGASGDMLKKYESKNIHVQGWVDDIREAYLSARIFVAPLFTGAGLQNKLLEAMSSGIPCITTPITNVSLLAKEDLDVLIANTAEEFVRKIDSLLSNEEQQVLLSQHARAYIEQQFTWETANEKLISLFNSI